ITPGGLGMDFLQDELAAAQRIGLTQAHFVDRAPLPDFDTGKCLCYPDQAQFHPLEYLRGVAQAIERNGGDIHNQTHVPSTAGGEDHKTAQANDPIERFAAIENWTRQRFPAAREVILQWSGQTMEPVDCLAYIGRNPLDADNIFIATGDSGMGMTHGTIAGILLTDLIVGRKNPWTELYDPSRKTLKALKDFTQENVNVAAQYTDVITGGEVGSVDEI